MKLKRILLFAGGVAVIALVTAAIVYIRHEIEETRESIREMVREAAVEAGQEAGKEVRAGLIEGMDNVADRAEQMPARIFDSATNELQQRFTGFAERIGGDGELPGRVLENVLDIVTGPAESDETDAPVSLFEAADEAGQETSEENFDGVDVARDVKERLQETLSRVVERVDDRGGELPRKVLEDVLGDFADLPEPPIASVDDQASSGSLSRVRSGLVAGDVDGILQQYVPAGTSQPPEIVDRVLDDPGINVSGLIDGILAQTVRPYDAEEGN